MIEAKSKSQMRRLMHQLKAGRELDALVAERIMGYSGRITLYLWADRKKRAKPYSAFKNAPVSASIGSYSAYVDEEGQKVYCGRPHSVHFWPYYSTSISSAWQIVEESNGWLHLTCDSTQKMWTAQFMGMDVGVTGDTAPHAICLAALKAVE